jgi:hypothetical protein
MDPVYVLEQPLGEWLVAYPGSACFKSVSNTVTILDGRRRPPSFIDKVQVSIPAEMYFLLESKLGAVRQNTSFLVRLVHGPRADLYVTIGSSLTVPMFYWTMSNCPRWLRFYMEVFNDTGSEEVQ